MKDRFMAKHTGNLIITSENAAKYAGLTEVTGALYIYADAKLDVPALTSVGGALHINAGAKLDAPALTSVGGALYIHAGAKLDAPALYAHGFGAFRVYDGIGCVIRSYKAVAGTIVMRCRQSKIKDGKLIGDLMYVAEIGNQYAHGNTAREAMSELRFKSSDRDLSEYRNMALTTRKTRPRWVEAYRMVTGACRMGTDMFLAGKTLKASYTLSEVLELTRGQYGADRFAEIVKGAK